MSVLKPGIITRLSNLIVVQVLFIFAALALILFVPDSGPDSSARLGALGRDLARATDRLSERLSEEWMVRGDLDEGSRESIRLWLDSLGTVEDVAVVRVNDTARIDFVLVYERAGPGRGDGGIDTDVSTFIDLGTLREQAAGGSCFLQPLLTPKYLAFYRVLDCRVRSQPLVLVAAARHELAISARSSLQYTIFVLFLCSTLVSLLTVSLLSRKFKRPLDRIISGLGETAEGKLHHLADLETDPELGPLARAYNSMTRRLWDNRRQLDDFFTRLRTANAELSESQSFLKTLIDSSPLGIVVTAPDGGIVMFNRAAVSEFGYEPGEISGRNFETLLAEKLDRPARSTDPEGRGGFEVICRRKNGLLFPAHIISSEVLAEDGVMLANLYVCSNITESRDFQDMMIRLDRYYTRGEMTGDIAHEINNYLAVLMGNVELLPLLLKKGDAEKVTRKLEVMHTMLQNISCLSDGLLDSPSDAMRVEPASINQLVEKVIAFLKPQNKFDTVEVISELCADVPVVYIDISQVQQLLVNLICNAAEALADAADKREIRLTTSLDEINNRPGIRVTVRDNGSGVVPDKEHLLFKSRFTTKRRGHGIGLITCRKIVDNHHGTISYAYEGGAVFTVVLPMGVRSDQEETPPAEKSPIERLDVVRS